MAILPAPELVKAIDRSLDHPQAHLIDNRTLLRQLREFLVGFKFGPPTIKPLDWQFGSTGWRAVSIVGTFHVGGGIWTLTAATGISGGKLGERDDETAKASAQAHYEALIRTALDY